MDIFNAVEIEINHGCNMACSYCPNSVDDRIEKGQMPAVVYSKIISELKSINYSGRISYSFYNEPMLSAQLEEYVALARQELPDVSIEIYSNGTLLTSERFRKLIKCGVTKFIITKHEDVNSNYEFDKTLNELSSDELKHLNYRSYRDIKLTNRGGMLKNIGSETSTAFMPCHLPKQMLTITVKGNVIGCFEDFYQKNQMGNIMENSLMEIWKTPRYEEFRMNLSKGLRHKYEACKDCNRWEVL
jgi:radical SAM protein with 4Fe4S-binding SPASM domain